MSDILHEYGGERVSPGLRDLYNKHLLSLMINPDRQMTPSAAAAVDHLFDFSDAAVKVEMPSYYYTNFLVCHLVPNNKVNPEPS